MTAKEKVLAVYPKAYSFYSDLGGGVCISTPQNGRIAGGRLSGYFGSREEAWVNAASRLPTPVEPKAHTDTSKMEEMTDAEFDTVLSEPKAQVEPASVEPKPICECGHEENQHWPESKDKYKLRRCSDLGCDCELYEPKEVESGEGLPPDENTQEDMNRGQELWIENYLNAALDRRPFALVKSYRRQATLERQLKASLLREKGLSDLLKFVEDVIGGWDTLHSFGCSVEDEEIEKLAAVTGDRV